ncbi:hypothetical protein [Sphingomicrobium astaxanthinifaciens]|uniref:hypothetical protein n=1 Tax=Sphingomicrobium astaxanthinifaciens TaxID=1227949 RepID=UPI001FCB2A92|nr:hypothetical protein [Sphingomicrobium astaxanthinifaciens]MCJ7420508.1 hypothetical protein [Sphingomicrobium astaxanthinifaciens]
MTRPILARRRRSWVGDLMRPRGGGGRVRRYVPLVVAPVLAIWLLTIAYLALAPARYDSRFTLILPGTGMGASLNLESIGQASTSTASPFASSSVSPTENYKRLLLSDRVRAAAAARLDIDPDEMPSPLVKLTDQTNLIEVRVSAREARTARQRAEALRGAFQAALDALRDDEVERRERAEAERIAGLAAKVDEAQRALLVFQGETGLVSLDQFADRIAALDALRDREREARTQVARSGVATARLSGALDADVATARHAMLLRADPLFQEWLERYARIAGEAGEIAGTLGEAHPRLAELEAERLALEDRMAARGARLTGLDRAAVLRFRDLAVRDGRSALMQALVQRDTEGAGSAAALDEIQRQIGEQATAAEGLVRQASTLAGLVRDLRVTEAVFSSALARLDTNKTDPFASYPLVQTLETPQLPERRAAPSPQLAIAGALGATILTLLAFGLLWLRQPIIRHLFPNG